ncbi:MAG: aminotransferase class I/II-fold pyridoxal phosphate-dependent enzyme [Acidobacteriota bacterium]
MQTVAEVNAILDAEAPLLARFLSRLGRDAFFPPDIPFQAQEARGTTYNGTIGVFTDGAGGAVPLPSMSRAFELDAQDLSRAFLYSPVVGLPELRRAWASWQRGGQLCGEEIDAAAPTSLPVVTCGLSHGLSLIADLFGQPGRGLSVVSPYWGNYRQIYTMRTGTAVHTAPAYADGVWRPEALPELLATLSDESGESGGSDEPTMALVNFPSNPGGYMPTADERRRLVDGLLRIADQRPLLVLSDDAYSGLVYADDAPSRSLFWDLAGRHENLLAVKLDGATKEFSFFGGRVGFVTFGLELSERAQSALDNKFASMIRSTVGSPVASSQVVLLQSLRGDAEAEVNDVRRVARARYDAVMPVLETVDRALLRPLPFNAGFFVLMELPEELGLDPHDVRRYLIARHDVGIVGAQPNYLRLATCSVAAEMLPEMMRRIEAGVRELAGEQIAAGT